MLDLLRESQHRGLKSLHFGPACSPGQIELVRFPSRTNHIIGIRDAITDQIAVRHPEGEHNVLGKFNGSPENKDRYGLTRKGRMEGAALIPSFARLIDLSGKPLFIVHSDFRRTREFAHILRDGLGERVCGIEERIELRERNPGSLEGIAYRDLLARFGRRDREDDSERTGRSRLKHGLVSLVHRCNVLAKPIQHIFGLEPIRAVEERTTRLIRELHFRQQKEPMLVLLIGHEFSLGPALNAFLGRPPGLSWTNRHIPRARPFVLSVETAISHFLKYERIARLELSEAA